MKADELCTRTNRLADFVNVNEVALEQLQNLNNVQLVKKLVRESRFVHLFSDTSKAELASIEAEANSAPARLSALVE